MSNADQFMTAHRLGFRIERVSSRPDASCAWHNDPGQRHWRYEFRSLNHDNVCAGYFTQGSAHTDTPTAGEVLYCLQSDATAFENCADVLDFAMEFGYDLDTRKGVDGCRHAFEGCKQASADLRALLGDDGFAEFCETDLDE